MPHQLQAYLRDPMNPSTVSVVILDVRISYKFKSLQSTESSYSHTPVPRLLAQEANTWRYNSIHATG